MTDHVNQWLNAYHDGELKGRRLALVEAHLAECPACAEELAQIEGLSFLLSAEEMPAPSMTSEVFAARVGLRLSRKANRQKPRTRLSTAWNMIPAGVLIASIFFQSIMLVGGVFSVLQNLGFGPKTSVLLPETAAQLQNPLSQVSMMLAGWPLAFNSTFLLNLIVPALFGVFYLIWLAAWWMNQQQNPDDLTSSAVTES